MPIWALLFFVAFEGFLIFEAWRALAKGELWDFREYERRYIRRASNPLAFWSGWIILVGIIVFTAVGVTVIFWW